MLFFIGMVEVVSAAPIRYIFSGHVTSVTAEADDPFTAVDDRISGWVEVESDTFSPGGRIDEIEGIIDGYIRHETISVASGFINSNRPVDFNWGDTIASLPSSVTFWGDDHMWDLSPLSMSFSGVLEGTFRRETHFTGTLDSFQAVPEPATTLLFVTGIAALVGARFRSKKKV